MTERARCFDCGQLVSLGLGVTGVVTRTDGRKQYYCGKCLQKGATLKNGAVGSHMDYLKEQGWVKEFEIW